MRISELFSAGDLVVDFDPGDKWEAIRALVDHLEATGRLPGELSDEVLEAVLDRERSMSTGMENGIAIPHAAVDGLERAVGCMGVVSREDGLPFESSDGQPARVVVLLIIPREEKLLHIRTLADVARVLGKDDIRAEIVAATTPARAWAVLSAGDER